MQHVPGLFIAFSEGRGNGVFTACELNTGDLIEICPLLIVPPSQLAAIHSTILHDYYFLWPEKEGAAAIALGYGSMYNHNDSPNAQVLFDIPNQTIEMHCSHPIESGGEIFIDYKGGEKDGKNLWFKPL